MFAKTNGIEIWYETFGDTHAKPLLLIMGGCSQGVLWHTQFCKNLAEQGFYVIRYDHRDAGLSTCFDYAKNPYGLLDMANDALGLLDFLQIKKAHLFGVSLGSLLSEIMAAYHPDRVNSLLLLGSTCDINPMNAAYAGKKLEKNVIFSSPKQKYLEWMEEFKAQTPKTHEEKLAQRIEGWNQLGGSVFPLDAKINREMQEEFLARLQYPQGILNHIMMLNKPESEEIVRSIPSKIRTPAVILHGSEDPIFQLDHGYALSQQIKGSEYIPVNGMGHIPSDHFYDLYIKILKRQTALS